MTRYIQCQALDGADSAAGALPGSRIAFRSPSGRIKTRRTRRAAICMVGKELSQGRRGEEFSVPQARNSQGNLLSNDFK